MDVKTGLLILALLAAALPVYSSGQQTAPTNTPTQAEASPAAPPASAPTPVSGKPADSPGQTKPEQQTTSRPPEQAVDIPFDYAAMKEDVLIRLKSEPRITSPIQTLVSPEPQTYELFFREPMDRASVEAALQTRALEWTKEGTGGINPTFGFQWHNDRQLQVTATAFPATSEYQGSYLLDVTHARTKAGRTLSGPDLPYFRAVIHTPEQLWRFLADGTIREQLTSLTEPYFAETFSDQNREYLVMKRFKQYCECDGYFEQLYGLYNLKTGEFTHYPLPLAMSYQGEGGFIADQRGFFHQQPEAGISVPPGTAAHVITTPEFVHGTGFSRDHNKLFMAVGPKEPAVDLDLVIVDLTTKKEQRFPKALKGKVRQSELDDRKLPVTFHDDGTRVTFFMSHPTEYKELRYQYEWKTGKVTEWKPPVSEDSWAGYTASADGVYTLYPNAGLFKGTLRVDEHPYSAEWLGNSHRFAYMAFAYEEEETMEGSYHPAAIRIYDADSKKVHTIASKLYADARIIGSSPDGKWIYVTSRSDLRENE